MKRLLSKNELPLGFSFALAQNPEAMKVFSALDDGAQAEILQKARSVSSKGEMQSLVNNLPSPGRITSAE